jgi:hypothetical protein
VESISQLGLAFFGLTSETCKKYQINLYKQIHQICFYGNGGYDWNTVYNLPIYLRNFIFGEINKHYEKEKEEIDKAQNPNKKIMNPTSFKDQPTKKITPPNFKPSPSPIKYG